MGLWPSALWAAQVSLAWDACTNPVPEGYHIYQRLEGQAYDYTNPIWTGNATTCTISNLSDEAVHYFVIRSYAGSMESVDSNELRYAATSSGSPGNENGDADGDGVDDSADAFPNDATEWYDSDQDGIGDNFDTDDDGDGMPDNWEILNGLDPLKNDADQDPDGDGASNLEEYQTGSNPNTLPGNQAPDQPMLMYPSDGATGIEMNPELKAGDFNDPDAGDTHARSQWQIENAQDQSIVLDIAIGDNDLSTLQIPHLVLNAGTAFICRVRYFDQDGEASPWSADTTFTTAADTADKNGNGISDDQEVSDQVDLDDDGLADNQQETIKSVNTTDGLNQVGIWIESGPTPAAIVSAAALDAQHLPGSPFFSDETPFGLLGYKIQIDQPGATVNARLQYSRTLDPRTLWLRYDSITGFQDCTDNMQIQEDAAGVQLKLQDGGSGDADGVANGWIVDASGPLYVVDPPQSSASGTDATAAAGSGGGGGGCFIGSLFK